LNLVDVKKQIATWYVKGIMESYAPGVHALREEALKVLSGEKDDFSELDAAFDAYSRLTEAKDGFVRRVEQALDQPELKERLDKINEEFKPKYTELRTELKKAKDIKSKKLILSKVARLAQKLQGEVDKVKAEAKKGVDTIELDSARKAFVETWLKAKTSQEPANNIIRALIELDSAIDVDTGEGSKVTDRITELARKKGLTPEQSKLLFEYSQTTDKRAGKFTPVAPAQSMPVLRKGIEYSPEGKVVIGAQSVREIEANLAAFAADLARAERGLPTAKELERVIKIILRYYRAHGERAPTEYKVEIRRNLERPTFIKGNIIILDTDLFKISPEDLLPFLTFASGHEGMHPVVGTEEKVVQIDKERFARWSPRHQNSVIRALKALGADEEYISSLLAERDEPQASMEAQSRLQPGSVFMTSQKDEGDAIYRIPSLEDRPPDVILIGSGEHKIKSASPLGGGAFTSLVMLFGASTILGMVLPAISKGASSPVAEGLKQATTQVSQGDIAGAGVSVLMAVGIGLGLIAGGIAIKYGAKAVKVWAERRAVSTITEEAEGDREIAFRSFGEIEAELVEAVSTELGKPPEVGTLKSARPAERIVQEFLKGVIPQNKMEREALIRALTKVEVGTLRGEPVNFTRMLLGEVPGKEKIERALLKERGLTLEELLQELLRNRPSYIREVVYFYMGILIPEGVVLSRFEREFLSQSLVLRTLLLLHEIAPEVGFNLAAREWAERVENLREEYGGVLLKQLALPEKMEEMERAVQEEIKAVGAELGVQPIVEAIRENRVEQLTLSQKEIVLRAVMKAKIWNHGSSIWQVLEQVFGVATGKVLPSRIREEKIKITYMPQEEYERLEEEIAVKEGKEVFMKSRSMLRVRETGAGKWEAELILNGGYNTLTGLFYRALHELIYAMILNVQGRLPAEGQVNRELAGLINYYITAGGIFERLDKGVEYRLSREMLDLIMEVPEKGLTEEIVPSLVKAMPALVSGASEISTYEPIAGYEIVPEVLDLEGMRVFVFELSTLLKVKVRFGEVTVEPRSPAAFKVMENIIRLAEKEGKLGKIKFAFVSNIRGLSKEVMEEMLMDYMRDYGLSQEVRGQIIDKRLVLDKFTLRQTGKWMSTRDVYETIIRTLTGKEAKQVTGIEVAILTDNEKRWRDREKMKEILWVILSTPKKGEMLSTATGLVVAIEGQLSEWLTEFIRANYTKEEAQNLLNIIRTDNKVILPAAPVPRKYLERMEEERKIYKIQA